LTKGKACPAVFQLSSFEVFDYDDFYEKCINPKLAYHSIPHLFRFQKSATDNTVLCHYKMWSTHNIWLPQNKDLSPTLHTVFEILPPVPALLQTTQPNSKKRTNVRGAGKPKLKKARLAKQSVFDHFDKSSDSDGGEQDSPSHPLFVEEHLHKELPEQGIMWLVRRPTD
jgi:hypothetical protein